MHKCYVVGFSCASTRVLHVEIIPDLQGSSFIRALKQFMGKHGIPARLLLDNGKTFLDRAVHIFVNSKGIIWRLNVPRASWWGGLFESMVKVTKRYLKKTLKNASLHYDELETVLVENEGILKSCPLTFICKGYYRSSDYTFVSWKWPQIVR